MVPCKQGKQCTCLFSRHRENRDRDFRGITLSTSLRCLKQSPGHLRASLPSPILYMGFFLYAFREVLVLANAQVVQRKTSRKMLAPATLVLNCRASAPLRLHARSESHVLRASTLSSAWSCRRVTFDISRPLEVVCEVRKR